MSVSLGYANTDVPGWNGEIGAVRRQGPVEDPCSSCGRSERQHRRRFGECGHFWPTPIPPKPHEVAIDAECYTSWVCPFCEADNDVAGAAQDEWMECSGCSESAWVSW